MSLPPVSEFDIALAEREIELTYGDIVSVWDKSKTLAKFGRNANIGTTYQTVWEYGGDETYTDDNTIAYVSSSSAADTGVVMALEMDRVSGTGADQQFTFFTQRVTLNGQNAVQIEAGARISRAYVYSGTLLGDFYVFESDTLTAGVPDTASKVHITVEAATSGHSQSFKAATTFSDSDYAIITGGYASVTKKTAASVDFVFEVKRPGSVFRPVTGRIALNSSAETTEQIRFKPYVVVPKNCDIRIRAIASTTGVEVDATFQCYLAKVRD
jgi:hypothetical protein